MSPPTKDDAQRRADQIAAFRVEVAQLGREGLEPLDAQQRAAISAHHDALLQKLSRDFDVDTTVAGRRMSLGMRVASLLGAAALTAAVVSFVYRVWGLLPTAGQVTLLTAAPMLAVVMMVIAGRIEKTRYLASLLAIVGCAAFVLQTVVLGQLFNLRASPHVLAAWSAFALAVSIPWRLGVPFAWGVLTLVAYTAALTLFAADVVWTMFPERPETLLPGAALLIAASHRLPLELRRWARAIGLVLVLGSILVLSSTGVPSLLPMGADAIRVAYQFVAVVLAVVVIGLGLRSGSNDLVTIGSMFAGLFLLTRFVDWWWDWMPKYLFFLILAAVSIGWLWLLRLARRRVEVAQ